MTNHSIRNITPDWPAHSKVRSAVTTRIGGESLAPYDSFNLASHVGDDVAKVQTNREELRKELQLPSEPRWLKQVHGEPVGWGERSEPQQFMSLPKHVGVRCAHPNLHMTFRLDVGLMFTP